MGINLHLHYLKMSKTKRELDLEQDSLKFMRMMNLEPKRYTIDEVVKLINQWSMIQLTKEDVLKQSLTNKSQRLKRN